MFFFFFFFFFFVLKTNLQKVPDFSTDPKKVEAYQELFYLLQAESRYVAKLVYLVNIDEVQHFLDTVLITLYGAAFSPREEYLLLRLFQASIKNEMQVIKDIRGFIQAETVVPKMVITYNRRKQGVDYLKEVMGPLVKKVMEKVNKNQKTQTKKKNSCFEGVSKKREN